MCWERGRPARKRAECAAVSWKKLPISFRASRSFAGGTPAVSANHLIVTLTLTIRDRGLECFFVFVGCGDVAEWLKAAVC